MGFIAALNALKLPWSLLFGFVVIWVLLLTSKILTHRLIPSSSAAAMNGLQVTIIALNMLNTPLVAIFVIIIGMAFDLASKNFGVGSDAATGVIGAGIGLLTGQANHALQQQLKQQLDSITPPPAIDPLAQPVDPAQPSKEQ